MKTIFKVSLIIFKHFEDYLLGLKFDDIVPFLCDISKNEIFKNTQYFEIKEKILPIEEATKEYYTIENFSKLMKEMTLNRGLFDKLERIYKLYDVNPEKAINNIYK